VAAFGAPLAGFVKLLVALLACLGAPMVIIGFLLGALCIA